MSESSRPERPTPDLTTDDTEGHLRVLAQDEETAPGAADDDTQGHLKTRAAHEDQGAPGIAARDMSVRVTDDDDTEGHFRSLAHEEPGAPGVFARDMSVRVADDGGNVADDGDVEGHVLHGESAEHPTGSTGLPSFRVAGAADDDVEGHVQGPRDELGVVDPVHDPKDVAGRFRSL